MKYIMFECNGSPLPILFPEHIDHSMINRCIQAEYPGYVAVNAGFVSIGCDSNTGEKKAATYGKSVTLKLTSNPNDDYWINKMIE